MKYQEIKHLFPIDLQLFASKTVDEDDDDVENGGYQGNDDDEDLDPDDQDDKDPDEDEDPNNDDDPDRDPDEDEDPEKDPDEDSEEDPDRDPDEDPEEGSNKPKNQPNKKVDKVTAALIEQKRKNKELEKKLQAIEDQKALEAEQKANEQRIKDLITDGYGEAEARRMVENDTRLARLELENAKLKYEKLEKKCPGITDHMREIEELVKKSGLTPEEVYNARYRSSSEYDIKTKAEQAALHKQRQAQSKKGNSGSAGGSDKKPVRLTPSQEAQYKHLTKQKEFRNLTKAEFLKMSAGGRVIEE